MKTRIISGDLPALLSTTLLVALTSFCHVALADDTTQVMSTTTEDLPTAEVEFVKTINKFNKKQIVEKLGEPVNAEDVTLRSSGKVVASIWHYHYLNTAPDGSYYKTTELDFVDDKVVVVAFLNTDSEDDDAKDVQKYELPTAAPEL